MEFEFDWAEHWWIALLIAALLFGLLLHVLLESVYFIRMILYYLFAKFVKKNIHILEKCSIKGETSFIAFLRLSTTNGFRNLHDTWHWYGLDSHEQRAISSRGRFCKNRLLHQNSFVRCREESKRPNSFGRDERPIQKIHRTVSAIQADDEDSLLERRQHFHSA